jgi:hypothetical protein
MPSMHYNSLAYMHMLGLRGLWICVFKGYLCCLATDMLLFSLVWFQLLSSCSCSLLLNPLMLHACLLYSDRLHLVWSLASAAKQDSFGRAGLMTLASCVASCIHQSETNDVPCAISGKAATKCDGCVPTEVRSTDLLDVLWILSERSKQHFNPKYRLKGSTPHLFLLEKF